MEIKDNMILFWLAWLVGTIIVAFLCASGHYLFGIIVAIVFLGVMVYIAQDWGMT